MAGSAYVLGGIEVRSSFALPLLFPVPASVAGTGPSITVDRADAPIPARGPVLFRWPGRYGLTLHRRGAGWVFLTTHVTAAISADGRSVSCHLSDPDAGAEVLVRRILPRLAHRQGRVAFHAATVADDDAAILLLGASGAGKSTLAAALCSAGPWRLISDDISLVDGDASPPLTWPSSSGASLWPDSLAAFRMAPEACRAVAGHEEKRWLELAAGPPVPRRVGAFVFLRPSRGDDCALDPVPPVHAAPLVGAQLVSCNPSDHALTARSWAAVGRLVEDVPAYTFSYPRRFGGLAAATTALSTRFVDRAATKP